MFAVPTPPAPPCWLNAWLAGRAGGRRRASTGLVGEPAARRVLPGSARRPALSPALLLGELRRRASPRSALALPVPGDPLGLAGRRRSTRTRSSRRGRRAPRAPTSDWSRDRSDGRRRWAVRPAAAARPTCRTSRRPTADLRDALTAGRRRLADLDVASWNPDVADALMNLRAPVAAGRHDGVRLRQRPRVRRSPGCGAGTSSSLALARRRRCRDRVRGRAATRRPRCRSHARGRAAIVAACSSLDGPLGRGGRYVGRHDRAPTLLITLMGETVRA